MSRVAEQIRLTHADYTLSGSAGIQFWKSLLNGFDDEPARLELKPHEKLFLAILLDAIEVLKRDPHREWNISNSSKRTYDHERKKWASAWGSAKRWLMSNDDGYVFGFATICEHFQWSATWVRKKILEDVKQARDEKTHHAKPQRLTVRGQYRRPSGRRPVRV